MKLTGIVSNVVSKFTHAAPREPLANAPTLARTEPTTPLEAARKAFFDGSLSRAEHVNAEVAKIREDVLAKGGSDSLASSLSELARGEMR